jgi:hypothetical protein
MAEDENIVLKNKITELKERLHQIYSQSAIDANKSKAFENEFSLCLKACEQARNERLENAKLQNDVLKFGLAILTVVLAFAGYLFSTQTFSGIIMLLGFGFIATGCMFILLRGEIRIARAEEYCVEVETYFKQNRWSTELNEALNLSGLPMWEIFRRAWNKDLFADRPYRKTALYAPFRIAITFTDILAFLWFIQAIVSHGSEMSRITVISGFFLWGLVVALQMLFVNAIIDKVDYKIERDKEKPEGYKKEIIRKSVSWSNIFKLFFVLDILFPKESKKRPQ